MKRIAIIVAIGLLPVLSVAAPYTTSLIDSQLFQYDYGGVLHFEVLWELYSDGPANNFSHIYTVYNDGAPADRRLLTATIFDHNTPLTEHGDTLVGGPVNTSDFFPDFLALFGSADALAPGETAGFYMNVQSPLYALLDASFLGSVQAWQGSINGPQPVPEPGTFALMGVVAGLGALWRRRRSKKA